MLVLCGGSTVPTWFQMRVRKGKRSQSHSTPSPSLLRTYSPSGLVPETRSTSICGSATLSPSNLREPGQPDLAEPWQAETYAMAQTLIETGQIAAAQWASEFGAALRAAADRGAPDDNQTYYAALTE